MSYDIHVLAKQSSVNPSCQKKNPQFWTVYTVSLNSVRYIAVPHIGDMVRDKGMKNSAA